MAPVGLAWRGWVPDGAEQQERGCLPVCCSSGRESKEGKGKVAEGQRLMQHVMKQQPAGRQAREAAAAKSVGVRSSHLVAFGRALKEQHACIAAVPNTGASWLHSSWRLMASISLVKLVINQAA